MVDMVAAEMTAEALVARTAAVAGVCCVGAYGNCTNYYNYCRTNGQATTLLHVYVFFVFCCESTKTPIPDFNFVFNTLFYAHPSMRQHLSLTPLHSNRHFMAYLDLHFIILLLLFLQGFQKRLFSIQVHTLNSITLPVQHCNPFQGDLVVYESLLFINSSSQIHFILIGTLVYALLCITGRILQRLMEISEWDGTGKQINQTWRLAYKWFFIF